MVEKSTINIKESNINIDDNRYESLRSVFILKI